MVSVGPTLTLSTKHIEVSGFIARVLERAGQNPWKQYTEINMTMTMVRQRVTFNHSTPTQKCFLDPAPWQRKGIALRDWGPGTAVGNNTLGDHSNIPLTKPTQCFQDPSAQYLILFPATNSATDFRSAMSTCTLGALSRTKS